MNPSGGLVWHWHAWRHQHAWKESFNQIGQWLEEIPTPSKELVLIGASAGWMMPTAWLQRFEKVTTFDIDLFAAPLFRRRHGPALKASGTQLRCHTSDALTHLQPLLRPHNRAAILFDNVLGQIRFHHTSIDEASQRIEAITKALRGRSWGSVHDAYSGKVVPNQGPIAQPHRMKTFQTPHHFSDDNLMKTPGFAEFGKQLQPQGEWLDHLTANVFPEGTPIHHIAWPYSTHYCHWLQAGWVSE